LRSGMATALLHQDAARSDAVLLGRCSDCGRLIWRLDVPAQRGLGTANAGCLGRRRGTGAHTRSVVPACLGSFNLSPTSPARDLLPAWRAAVLAYRANMRVTRHPSPAYEAALAAFHKVLPDTPAKEAERQMTGDRLSRSSAP
jgi:hypothetical protein